MNALHKTGTQSIDIEIDSTERGHDAHERKTASVGPCTRKLRY
jgi:hypothetical protein